MLKTGFLNTFQEKKSLKAVKRDIMNKLLKGICIAGKTHALKGVYAKTDDLGGDIYEMRFFINGKK